jgi:hypothetical protein
MCIILVGKPEHITDKILLRAYNGNKDGFGLMYSKDNKIITEKFLPKKFKSVLKCFNKHAKNTNQIALHFRFATQGEKNNFNSHPFCILNKKLGDNFDLFLMHNSPLLPAPILDNKKSDTYFFSRYILKPIIKNKPDLIFNESFIKSLNKIINCETSSRVLLLNSFNNEFEFLGDWVNFENLKVSQTYSIQEYEKSTITYSRNSNFNDYNFKSYNSNNYFDFNSDNDYDNYSDNYYYDSDKTAKQDLLKKALFKKHSKKKNKDNVYLNYQNLSHIFDNGTNKEIFKTIKKLTHKQISDLIADLRDDKKILDEIEDNEIQLDDLKYNYEY